ncbi:tyrosine-type recombinase/integrase [Thiorhodospira sibirica]|uniref:tyrosine-type recombinase/integrase n=1 Tax=Thiorhodospira sibirica TaxID=154347 RepID=UPI00022C2DE4|nr:tyrosine-type recombinase/integrase [Thiorhodospira sibirica]
MSTTEPLRDIPAWLVEMMPQARQVNPQNTQYWLSQSWADNTLRGYRAGLEHFCAWCGIAQPLPTSSRMIAAYLSDHAQCLAPSTLSHRVAALSFAHRLLNAPDPTQDAQVRAVLRGIHRHHAQQQGWQTQQVPPLKLEQLWKMVQGCGQDQRALRDRCYLLLGFFGAFRQSELSALKVAQLQWVDEGLLIHMGPTKTDPLNEHRAAKAFVEGAPELCPLAALRAWLAASQIHEGYVFRGIDRNRTLRHTPLTHPSANRIIKERARAAGIAHWAQLSTHSLRAGFITAARELEAQNWQIMRQSQHRDERTLNIYDRPDSAFKGNAVISLMRHAQTLIKTPSH